MDALEGAILKDVARLKETVRLTCVVSTGERIVVHLEGVRSLRVQNLGPEMTVIQARNVSEPALAQAAASRLLVPNDEPIDVGAPLSLFALRGAGTGCLVCLCSGVAVLPEMTGGGWEG